MRVVHVNVNVNVNVIEIYAASMMSRAEGGTGAWPMNGITPV